MPTLRLAPWAAALALAAPLHAQQTGPCTFTKDQTYWSDASERYCEQRVERIPRPSGPLAIDAGQNGSIGVRGTDGDSIVVTERIETVASTEAEARAMAGEIHIVTAGGTIHAEGPAEKRHFSHWLVSYRVTAPHKIDLALDAQNGSLRVSDIASTMRLNTVNGAIELDAVGGDVRARGENGSLDIALSGKRWAGTGLDAETENGPVDLTLPDGYAAHIEVGTVNGPMDIGIPMTIEGHVNLKHLSTDLGGGGPTIRAITTNGPVSIKRE
jgi:hypothetical protein